MAQHNLQLPAMDPAGASDRPGAFDLVSSYAVAAMNWYAQEKKGKAIGSKACRIGAIVSAACGALIPMLALARPGLISTNWGYVLFVLAGALIGYDRLFGLSASWMRYARAMLQLQALVFKMEVRRKASSGAVAEALILEYAEELVSIVAEETNGWSSEFSRSVEGLAKSIDGASGRIN